MTVKAFAALLCITAATTPALAQSHAGSPPPGGVEAAAPAGQPDPRRMMLPTPAEEDWSFLADPKERTDPFDAVKYVPLGGDGAYASFGGEGRVFIESVRNENFGQAIGTNTYAQFRALLHADVHLNPNVRIYAATQAATTEGRAGGPRPSVDRDQLDLLEGFIELRSSAFDQGLRGPQALIRIGRQQLDIGSGRLVSSRAGPITQGANVLLGFDGARFIGRRNGWRLDVFAARPNETRDGVFNDGWLDRQGIWGAYLARGGPPGAPVPGFDIYYIGTTRPNAPFFSGVADETRHSVGVRTYRQNTPFAYDLEAIYQFGRFGARNISAWAITGEATYTFSDVPWTPQPGIRVAADSGGGRSGALKTFYVPFPRGAYFGNLSAIGPANTMGIEGALALHPTPSVTVTAGSFFFWRTSRDDGVYGLAGFPLLPPTNRERFIGYQPVAQVSWQVNPHVVLNAAFETFRRGDFVKATPGTRSIDYFAIWGAFRF